MVTVQHTDLLESSLLERQPQLLALQLTSMAQAINKVKEDDGQEEGNKQVSKVKYISRTKGTALTEPVFQWRLRFLRQQWYFNGRRSYAGWDLSLRVFTVISRVYGDGLLVWNCIRNDDAEALQELFRIGKVSPSTLIFGSNGVAPVLPLAVS